MYHFYSIHSSVDGYLGCFYFLAIVSHAAMNIYVKGFVWTYLFIPLGSLPWSGIAGSYGDSMFNLLRPKGFS